MSNKISKAYSQRPDGSVLYEDGVIVWYNEIDDIHRENAPAAVYEDGRVEWYLHNHEYTFDEWCIALNKTDEDKMMLRLQYG
jgi:hypothetical protein